MTDAPPTVPPATAPATAEAAALDAYSQVVVAVAERLRPSVASLLVRTRAGRAEAPRGSGSAVVLTAEGLLVTSAHVVHGTSGGVAVFDDGRELDYEVVGTDRLSDLAVVRAASCDLDAAELGDADRLRVGQLVVAVGNPLGFGGSVSAGVVSACNRSITTGDGRHARVVEDVIQTDAALHPGNSGGALADSAGRVVGINTAVVGPMIGQGLGLAVPVNAHTRGLLTQLVEHGTVRRAWLGIGGGSRPLPPRVADAVGRTQGVEVTSVVSGSPAERAGLRTEDLLLALDGEPVRTIGDLQRLLDRSRVGRRVRAEIARGGRVSAIDVEPAPLHA